MALEAFKSRLDFDVLLDQSGRLLKLESALPHLALVPERMVMRDAVNQPFELVLDAIGSSTHFELKSLIGEQLSVRLLQPDGSYKPWHGYVTEAAQLGSDGGFARYRLVMQPWLAMLGLRRDAFVFQDKTAQEIIEDVFRDYATARWRFALADPLRPRSLCTQYRESDLAFVHRLLAEEGLSYYFEHLGESNSSEDESQAKHVLVITDRASQASERPALGTVRFTGRHPTANLPGQKDAVTAFMAQRELQANAVAMGSWNYKQLVGHASETSTALDIGELPLLEIYDGAGTYRYADAAQAERAASLALSALELNFERFEGQGSTRHFEAGRTFRLIDHPLFGAGATAAAALGLPSASAGDNEFVLLAVEHHAANNLGANAAQLLSSSELERGSYANHFHAARAALPVIARSVHKPLAPGLQTAVVVGLDGEALSTDRDLRVKVQFAWQRGTRPLAGGLAHLSAADTDGHAPRDLTSGTWMRVVQAAAGANWGTVFVPRIGAEVAISFIEADIDRPVVVGGLYNGQDSPPFAAGEDSGVNHPGMIDGWHSQALDGAGFNQWVLDNATGQLRMRLHASYTAAELGLGHLIQQGSTSAERGAWRGAGFESTTQGWASLRAGRGLLLSTSARAGSHGSAQSTQMDAAEALAQLKAARELGTRLSDAASASSAASLASHAPERSIDKLLRDIDPAQDGKHPGPVNGQAAQKADGRTLGDPVEAFAGPHVVLDTPSTALWVSEAGIAAYAGQDWSLVAQGDLQQTAGHTFASVSGRTSSWYTHEGGAKLHAANGAVSLQAHTDTLQILADREVTVVSVNDEITIAAKTRIELVAGQSSVVLDGENIDFSCPGQWTAKGSAHAFLGGESRAANGLQLPTGLAVTTHWVGVHYLDGETGEPVNTAEYEIHLDGGPILTGTLDAQGQAEHQSVDNKLVKKVLYKPRKPELEPPHDPIETLLG